MQETAAPSDWLLAHIDALDRTRQVLDVACGRGRHALELAARGFRVHAIDANPDAVAALARTAASASLPVTTGVVDLEGDHVDLGGADYGTVLVFNYLHRPLMSHLRDALAPGGILLYETFTIGQAQRGHPRNPLFLLQAGELPALVAPLRVIDAREGDFNGKLIASVVAVKA
jgi:SAM-dependent methyltransferase